MAVTDQSGSPEARMSPFCIRRSGKLKTLTCIQLANVIGKKTNSVTKAYMYSCVWSVDSIVVIFFLQGSYSVDPDILFPCGTSPTVCCIIPFLKTTTLPPFFTLLL